MPNSYFMEAAMGMLTSHSSAQIGFMMDWVILSVYI
jgi:hypothetical protein